MLVDSTKCKVRNPEEALFQADLTERIKEVSKEYNLPITHIRYGRQVKSWGSTAVATYHVYRYKTEGKVELWVNVHKANLTQEGRKYLEWAAIMGCMSSDKINKNITVDAADVTAFALKYKYKNNAALSRYFLKRKAADLIANTNFAMYDEVREAQLAEQAIEVVTTPLVMQVAQVAQVATPDVTPTKVASKEVTYTVTGAQDTYFSKVKANKPGNMYIISIIQKAQTTYSSKEDLISRLLLPAYVDSNLRSGNPSASDLRSMIAYLVREGVVTVA